MALEDLKAAIRDVLRESLPANTNHPQCSCNVAVASKARVNELLDGLDSIKATARTWERPLQRIVLHPTPEQRALVGGRRLG